MNRGRQTRPKTLPSGSGRCAELAVRGKTATRAGRKAEARYFFRCVLEIDPGHREALLWMAYLAGGGRPSLKYLARLLEVDPTNQPARAAIRWARNRAATRVVAAAPVQPARPARGRNLLRTILVVLVILTLGLMGGLATAAFVFDGSAPTPTRAQPIALIPTAAPTATSRPTATPSPVARKASPIPTRTATPEDTPSPETPSPSPPRSSATATPTATEPIPTRTNTQAASSPTETHTPTANPVSPLPVSAPASSPTSFPTASIGDIFRWIDVDLTHQRLVAFEGETPVRTVIVSTGLPRTPTVTGRFKIYVKYRAADMSGPGYYLRNVPYVMYFYRGYGVHGTYWHNNFGRPMSHGCVNLPTPEAEWLFNWASVGTPVVVHY